MKISVQALIYCYRYIWTWQIAGALIYCFGTKRYLPIKTFDKKRDYHFVIKQLNFYFIGVIAMYIAEIYYEDIYWTMFERFLHHFFSILFFTAVIFEPNVICLFPLFPTFVHAIYWTIYKSESKYLYPILMVYNILTLVAVCILVIFSHWNTKRISIRCPLFVIFVFESNVMGHFYGYWINFGELDTQKFIFALLIATCQASLIYLYLIFYMFFNKEKKAKRQQETFTF